MQECWIFNDGGRADFGSVASAGDCACRAVAIATGEPYAETYRKLTELNGKTPRNGTLRSATSMLLNSLGWIKREFADPASVPLENLPPGRVVVSGDGHVVAVIDRVIHDTHDCRKDGKLIVDRYWIHPDDVREAGSVARFEGEPEAPKLDEKTTDRVKSRIRKLLAVAQDGAATEGEIRNAMRFAQNLMRKHSIERDDLGDDEDASTIRFTRQYVFLNGLRRTLWELDLARFIATDLCASCGYYAANAVDPSRDRRSAGCVYFYGTEDDVQFCAELFREMITTIAATARLKGYGGFARGDGALYCAGFVRGLRDAFADEQAELAKTPEGREVIELSNRRSLAIANAARRWLSESEGIDLGRGSALSGGRGSMAAYNDGRDDGRRTRLSRNQKRIGGPTGKHA